ncbi:MAG: TlpA family protein disulfide reductase [Anaerolineae bacterium]
MKKTAVLLLWISILTACGGKSAAGAGGEFVTPSSNQTELHQDDGHEHVHIEPSEATGQMEVVVVPSELVVGPNRFAVGLFAPSGEMIHDAQVHFHYYDLSNVENPVLESEADAAPLQTPDGRTTIFTQEREFNREGTWGVEVQAIFPDGTAALQRIAVDVTADSISITPGEKAPAITTPTAADVDGDLSLLTSALEPNPAFYEMSLTEALANARPTVFLLATPAFCQTRFCGPAYEMTGELETKYGDEFNFVHVEVFTGLPNPAENEWEQAPVMAAFGLNTEPWIYLIDRDGTVVYRAEGMFTTAEVERHLQTLLAGGSS